MFRPLGPFLFATSVAVSIAASTTGARASQAEAADALSALNEYIDVIQFNDACLGRRDARALGAPLDRADAARTHAAARYPELARRLEGSNTDYVCQRTDPPAPVDRAAIRRELTRLIDQLGDAVAR